MNKSEQIDQLTVALAAAYLEMEDAIKDAKGGGGARKYEYVTLPAAFDVCKKLLARNGIVISHDTETIEGKWCVSCVLTHISGQWRKSSLPLMLKDNMTSQDIGSAVTYMRRYTLMAMLALCGTQEDDDAQSATDAQTKANEPPKSQRLIRQQLDAMVALLTGRPDIEQRVMNYYKINKLSDIPPEHYESTMKQIAKEKELPHE